MRKCINFKTAFQYKKISFDISSENELLKHYFKLFCSLKEDSIDEYIFQILSAIEGKI